MLQKRRLQAGWDDNRSQSSTPPALTYTCTLVVGGAACTNPTLLSGTESNVYDNNGITVWKLVSGNTNTKWAITETYTSPVTVKTVISRMFYCTATKPCRVYIGNSADYTQNTQCGADWTAASGYNMFTCNLQGKYVTSVMYSAFTGYDVQLFEEVNFANSIIPRSAM